MEIRRNGILGWVQLVVPQVSWLMSLHTALTALFLPAQPPPGPCWDWSLADLAGLVSPSPWGCVGAGGTALSSGSSSHTNNHTVLQPLLLCQTRASMKKSQNKKQLDLGNLCKIGCNLAGKRKMQKNNFKPKEFRGENS